MDSISKKPFLKKVFLLFLIISLYNFIIISLYIRIKYMVEGFTPNEILIAQEKKAKRDKGLEEAKVYRVFLDRLRDQFSMLLVNTFGEQRILQTNEIQEETKSLKELGINSISIIKIANKAIDETNTATNAKLDLLDIFPDSGDSIVNMTPKQFMEYISDLKKQLIQE